MERLYGYFPRTAASDPEIFTVGLLQLLATYPQSTIESMLSPISGLPAKHKFLPSIAEIREWLEEHAPARGGHSISGLIASQLAERKRLDQICPPPPPRVPFKQQLMETFKIRDVPHGMDACDLINLRKHYGYNVQGFQDHIERLLTGAEPEATKQDDEFRRQVGEIADAPRS